MYLQAEKNGLLSENNRKFCKLRVRFEEGPTGYTDKPGEFSQVTIWLCLASWQQWQRVSWQPNYNPIWSLSEFLAKSKSILATMMSVSKPVIRGCILSTLKQFLMRNLRRNFIFPSMFLKICVSELWNRSPCIALNTNSTIWMIYPVAMLI